MFVLYLSLKHYFTIKASVLEFCDHGTIVDLYVKIEKGDNDHYAIVAANENQLRIKVPPAIYSTLSINEEVTLYANSLSHKLLLTKRV